MKKKVLRNTVLGLCFVGIVVAVAASFVLWHQPETPDCIA